MRINRVLMAVMLMAGLATACSSAAEGDALRLGYFPNITHATAVAGIEKDIFATELGDTKLELKTFNAGPAVVEALFSGRLDAAYIGPSPAINAFARSNGEAIRIISGATSGGTFLVVRPGIKGATDLRGKTLATPQLGNTQDVALRAWLASKGLETDTEGGGDVSIKPQENAQSLETFRSGGIDGAWLPEPWATRLIQEGDAKVLVDERDLWDEGRFVTVHLIARTDYLRANAVVIEKLLRGHLAADEFVRKNTEDAKTLVNAGIARVTDKPLPTKVLDAAWKNLTFTVDPIASSLRESADDATELGLLEEVDLNGIYALGPLNELLAEQGLKEVAGM